MHLSYYPISAGLSEFIYEFVSQGPKGAIRKAVVFSPMRVPGFFNLGFGDINLESNPGDISDQIITDNGDTLKVLATVAAIVMLFTDSYPDAAIYAVGSTDSRTRLYRMAISKHLYWLEAHFVVFGFIHGRWEPFIKSTDYEAFYAIRNS